MQLFQQIQIYIPLFKKGWWIVALSTLFAIAFSLYLSYTAIPVYQTNTKVIITDGKTPMLVPEPK